MTPTNLSFILTCTQEGIPLIGVIRRRPNIAYSSQIRPYAKSVEGGYHWRVPVPYKCDGLFFSY